MAGGLTLTALGSRVLYCKHMYVHIDIIHTYIKGESERERERERGRGGGQGEVKGQERARERGRKREGKRSL